MAKIKYGLKCLFILIKISINVLKSGMINIYKKYQISVNSCDVLFNELDVKYMNDKDINKDISVFTKIRFSLLFPISVMFHSILFFTDKNKRKKQGGRYNKQWWNDIIYNIREEYERNCLTVIGYSFFPAIVYGSIIYVVECYPFRIWSLDLIKIFSIVLAIGALLVSIIIAMVLKKRTIESGLQFMDQLYIHINYLKHIPLVNKQPHILYIISPNINLGTGIDYRLVDIIKDTKNITQKIKIKFICKSISTEYLKKYPNGSTETAKKHTFFCNATPEPNNSEMLNYLYGRYYDNSGKKTNNVVYDSQIKNLDELVNELNVILYDENFEFIQVYNKFVKYIIDDNNFKFIQIYNEICRNKNVCGYLSSKECVLGTYINVKEKKGKIIFRGETFTSSEFIKYLEEKCINKIIGV
jgi:hypothetical protein